MGTASSFLDAAMSRLGTPYVWGGDNPQAGFDCSGLVFWAAHQAGAPMPYRTTWQMLDNLPRVSNPTAGDLVILDGGGHVGICLDDGCTTMLDAPHTGANVRTESLQGWGPPTAYLRIPGLTPNVSPGESATYLQTDWQDDLNNLGNGILSFGQNATGDITGMIGSEMAKLPNMFLQAFFGADVTAGQILIRFCEVLGGCFVLAGGVVMFVMAFRANGPQDDGSTSYRAVADQVRTVQHAAEMRAQRQRGVERRETAVRNKAVLEAQHQRGRERRALADANRLHRLNQKAAVSTDAG